jgi:hypothetical protein
MQPLPIAADLIAAALEEARFRLARFGQLVAFGRLVAQGRMAHEIDGLGDTGTARLDFVYQGLRDQAEQADAAIVVSEGSADGHANLLIVFAEARGGGAARAVAAIAYARKPIWIGPIKARDGKVSIAPLAWEAMPARIWPQPA